MTIMPITGIRLPNAEFDNHLNSILAKRKAIFGQNQADYDRLVYLNQYLIDEWGPAQPLIPYTIHDWRHNISVEKRLYQLLPLDEFGQFNEKEKFLLLASIWLHDIGMIPDILKEKAKRSTLYQNPEKIIEKYNVIREKHAIHSKDYINENWRHLRLEEQESKILMEMVEFHRYEAYKSLHSLNKETTYSSDNPIKIRVPLLISYLRLADALDIPLSEDTTEFKIYLAYGLHPNSLYHWFKSIYTYDVHCENTSHTITIELKRPDGSEKFWHEELDPLKLNLSRSLQNELDAIKDILIPSGMPYYLQINCTCRKDPGLTYKKKRDLEILLKNLQLFDYSLTPNSSSLMNSIIYQIRTFLEIPDDIPKEERELHYVQNIGYLKTYQKTVIDDILKKNRLHILIYTLSEKLQELLYSNKSPGEITEKILDYLNDLEEERTRMLSEISNHFRKELDVKFKQKNEISILLYAFSTTVVKCITDYHSLTKKNINLFICEARTKTLYRYNNRLVYSDGITYAKEILKNIPKKKRLSIQIVTDSCASYLFSNNKVDLILFGANGISPSGRVTHSLGHLAIADMAKHYRIPVYVLGESLKIHDLIDKIETDLPESQIQRKNDWLTTDIDYVNDIAKLTKCNPRRDILPPDRIFAIITESGVKSPNQQKLKV